MLNAAAHDFETCAVVDLRKTGVDAYAEHVETSVLCMSWRLPDGRRGCWFPGDPDPAPFLEHITAGGTVSAWNSPFESAIWHYVIRRMCPHWPQPRLDQFSCTMARALVLALPGALDRCAIALELDVAKDKIGQRLMMKMCRPTTAWRKWEADKSTGHDPAFTPGKWHCDPADLRRLGQYCDTDVDVEIAIGERIAQLTPGERQVWLLDQTINRRGIRLDLPSVRAAMVVAEAETKRLNAELSEATGGQVKRVTKTKDMLNFLADELAPVKDLRKRTVGLALAQRMHGDDPARPEYKCPARRVLEIRREASKASVAKLKAMEASVNTDGRARGLLGYHVATTGRWAGRRIQPQNFPRPNLKQKHIEAVLELLPQPMGADHIRFGYADPLDAVASSLRALIIPSPGRKFIGGDYSNIEGRVVAWLAGEEWKIQAFREYDAGTGKDLYILAYARSFGIDPATIDEDDPRRQVGKVQELSLGYQGGPGAFVSMGLNYNIDVADIAERVHAIADPEEWAYWSDRAPDDPAKRFQLSPFNWVGLRCVVQAWRRAHPAIVELWREMEDLAIAATENPGTIYSIRSGLVRFSSNKSFLFCQLPSGRCLAYARPHCRFIRKSDGEIMAQGFRPSEDDRALRLYKRTLLYFGQGKKSKKWERRKYYGGLGVENATQATARDRLVAGLQRAEAAGYPVVLHVHDDILTEVRADFGDPGTLRELMCQSEGWDSGLPVAAKTWRGERFQK